MDELPEGTIVNRHVLRGEMLEMAWSRPKVNVGDVFTVIEENGQLITYTIEKASAQFARDSLETLIPETSANKLARIDVFTLEDCAGHKEFEIRDIVGNRVFEQIQNAMGILSLSFTTFSDGGGT